MKKYKFLFKPAFFIFNIVFASWLVIKIERLSPSDMGRFRSLFENKTKQPAPLPKDTGKYLLKKLCIDYKQGTIDNNTFDARLEKYMQIIREH